MRLDAALLSPDLDWLTLRSEKVAYLKARSADVTAGDAQNLANQFPGTFPIGIDRDGHVVLLYIATAPWTDDFRTFLVGHTALLGVTMSWTLRVVLPSSLQSVVGAYQAAADEELGSPMQPKTIRDLAHHFFHRRRRTDLSATPEPLRATLVRYAATFDGARFAHLYRRWLVDPDAALAPISATIPEAFASGRARVECVVLPHAYEHLAPLVNRPLVGTPGSRDLDEEGDEAPRAVNPFLNPVP